MKQSAITMLVLALLFVGISAVFLYFNLNFAFTTIMALGRPDNPASVLVGFFLFIAMLPFCAGTIGFSAAILPFDIILMKKLEKKTWYSIVILIYAIVAIAIGFLSILIVPLASNAINVTSSSSSAL